MYRGLVNPGVLCYFNATLQQLARHPLFCETFLHLPIAAPSGLCDSYIGKKKPARAGNRFIEDLYLVLYNLTHSEEQDPVDLGHLPLSFEKVARKAWEKGFKVNKQQDCMEVLMMLLEQVQLYLKQAGCEDFVTRFFNIKKYSEHICSYNDVSPYPNVQELFIVVGTSKANNLVEELNRQKAGEWIEDSLCSKCGSHGRTAHTYYTHLPSTLLFQINRFVVTRRGRTFQERRIEKEFQFPYDDEYLDMNEFCIEPQKTTTAEETNSSKESDSPEPISIPSSEDEDSEDVQEVSASALPESRLRKRKHIDWEHLNARGMDDDEIEQESEEEASEHDPIIPMRRHIPPKERGVVPITHSKKYVYSLQGIIVRDGVTTQSGHFMSIIKERQPPHRWVLFSDKTVEFVHSSVIPYLSFGKVNLDDNALAHVTQFQSQYVGSMAYVLLYESIEPEDPWDNVRALHLPSQIPHYFMHPPIDRTLHSSGSPTRTDPSNGELLGTRSELLKKSLPETDRPQSESSKSTEKDSGDMISGRKDEGYLAEGQDLLPSPKKKPSAQLKPKPGLPTTMPSLIDALETEETAPILKELDEVQGKIPADVLQHYFYFVKKWLKRRHIRRVALHGDAGDTSAEVMAEWLEDTLKKYLLQYDPEDVYNADETGLFYKQIPVRSYVGRGEKRPKGTKKDKSRVTLLLCVSMVGELRPPLFISRRAIKPQLHVSRPGAKFCYTHQKRAWMDTHIWNTWLKQWDKELDHLHKNILLIVDNAAVHAVTVPLSHIRVLYLPPNHTSILQPCDQTPIKSLKNNYSSKLMSLLIERKKRRMNLSLTMEQYVSLLIDAYYDITDKVIQSGFKAAGWYTVVSPQNRKLFKDVEILEPDPSESELKKLAGRLLDADPDKVELEEEDSEEDAYAVEPFRTRELYNVTEELVTEFEERTRIMEELNKDENLPDPDFVSIRSVIPKVKVWAQTRFASSRRQKMRILAALEMIEKTMRRDREKLMAAITTYDSIQGK